jgi:hypothetical protein
VIGYFALLDASDLTGDACGFTLAPEMDTYFDAYNGATTSVPQPWARTAPERL